jgi:hypothetical protein
VIRVVAHAELAPDNRRHALGGPDIAPEAEHLGTLGQQRRELRPLLHRQFRLGPGTGPALQRLDPTLTSAPHPLAHRPSRHPERFGNRLLPPPPLVQLPGPESPFLSPLPWLCDLLAHTPESCTPWTL